MHSYRELTAPELVTAFASLGGRINKGRDSHVLSVFMKERGATPVQLLYAMGLKDSDDVLEHKDILYLLRSETLAETMIEDELLIEAIVAWRLSPDPMPACYFVYGDLLDQGVPNARNEAAFLKAKEELGEFCDNALSKPASFGSRSRIARQHHIPRTPDSSPG